MIHIGSAHQHAVFCAGSGPAPAGAPGQQPDQLSASRLPACRQPGGGHQAHGYGAFGRGPAGAAADRADGDHRSFARTPGTVQPAIPTPVAQIATPIAISTA